MAFPGAVEENEEASTGLEDDFDPFGGDQRSELDELLGEVEKGGSKGGGRSQGATRQRSRRSRQPNIDPQTGLPEGSQPKTTSKALWILWPLLILVSTAAALLYFQPPIAQEVELEVRALFYPIDRARDALQEKDYPKALTAAQEALSTNTQPGYAHFLAGRALIAMDRNEEGVSELKRAIARAEEWSTIMSSARTMQEAGAYEESATAYIQAFEQGASLTQMPEIIKAQLRAGDFEAARRMISIYERGTDNTFDAEGYLDSLREESVGPDAGLDTSSGSEEPPDSTTPR